MIGLEAAVTVVARGRYEREWAGLGLPWDRLEEGSREQWRKTTRLILEAAYPVIEAAVRAEMAAEADLQADVSRALVVALRSVGVHLRKAREGS